MGGLRPCAACALAKCAPAEDGSAWGEKLRAGTAGLTVAATVWQIWQLVQEWQSPEAPAVSAPTAPSASATMAAFTGSRLATACPGQSGIAPAALGDPASACDAVPACAGSVCMAAAACAAGIWPAIVAAAQPRRGSRAIMRMRNQWRMEGMIRRRGRSSIRCGYFMLTCPALAPGFLPVRAAPGSGSLCGQ